MIKNIILASTISALTFGGVAQASVAQIISIDGKAIVERAEHRYLAQRGMVLEEGDIVRSLKGNVKLKYANCVSSIEESKEVAVSKATPCPAAKLAKASDLKDIAGKNYKIQRIDSNLAAANCNACKVDLASAVPGISGSLLKGLAGAGAVGAAVSGNSNKPASP
ncbi:MAG: hypothetical protein V3U84_11620 [Thiotrichaceae bacterium]